MDLTKSKKAAPRGSLKPATVGTRLSKSAGSSPKSSPAPKSSPTLKSSPTSIRKALSTKSSSTDKSSLSDSEMLDVNDSLLLNVTTNSSPTKVSDVTVIIPHHDVCKEQPECPCIKTENKGHGATIMCSSCKALWHIGCCNLKGVTSSVIKKLENQGWKCPWCFTLTIKPLEAQTNEHTPSPAEINIKKVDEFLATMDRIETCKEELNDGISSVEFFNQHIKHLLLDDTRFKEQSTKVDKLSEDMTEIKEEIKQLRNMFSPTANIQKQLEDILAIPPPTVNLPKELKESVDKISEFPVEKLHSIDDELKQLTENMKNMQQSLANKSFNTRSEEVIMDPNTTSPRLTGPQDSTSDCDHF